MKAAALSYRRRGSRIFGEAKRTGDTMVKTKIIRRRVVEDAGVQRSGWEQVGRYMYCFGQLEQALGDLLHRSLGLSKRAARLLLPRVMYSAKLDLIETIIPMLKQPESWRSRAKLIVNNCRKFIEESANILKPNISGRLACKSAVTKQA
jgi:hypothetical protein